MKTILDFALEYAQRGWAPIPLKKQEKVPCLPNWPNVASSDDSYIRQHFTHHNGNIGIVCGKKSNLLVIDVDMPNGPARLTQLESQLGKLPDTLSQTTGGGGKQLFFLYPDKVEIKNSIKKLGDAATAGKLSYSHPPIPTGNSTYGIMTFPLPRYRKSGLTVLSRWRRRQSLYSLPSPLSWIKFLDFIHISKRRCPMVCTR